MSSQSERVTAIVLDRVPFKEHDRLYTLLTRERGLVRARARGASKPLAKVRPHVEGFGIVDVMLVRGRAGYVLASAEMLEPLRMRSVESQLLADAVRKTLARIMREEEGHTAIFEGLEHLLRDASVHAGGETGSLFARELHFYWTLLGELGYNGDAAKCSACSKPLADDARFVPMAGSFFCHACSKGIGAEARASLRTFLAAPYSGTYSGKELIEFSRALAEHFEHRLELPFPSIFR